MVGALARGGGAEAPGDRGRAPRGLRGWQGEGLGEFRAGVAEHTGALKPSGPPHDACGETEAQRGGTTWSGSPGGTGDRRVEGSEGFEQIRCTECVHLGKLSRARVALSQPGKWGWFGFSFLFIQQRAWLLPLLPCLGLFMGVCLPHKSAGGIVWHCDGASRHLSRTRTFLHSSVTVYEAGRNRAKPETPSSALSTLPFAIPPWMASRGYPCPPPIYEAQLEEHGLGIGSRIAITSGEPNEGTLP